MKRSNAVSAMWADFFRGFLSTSAVLLLALGILFGIHRAQTNTEQICFGTDHSTAYTDDIFAQF